MTLSFLVNITLISFGYSHPISLNNLLIGFDLLIIFLLLINYKINPQDYILKKINTKKTEKIFLIILILLVTLSILGTYAMQLTQNNIFLLILLVSIPIYVIFATIYGTKIKRIYPIIILLIGLSLQLIFMLRFPHIAGADVNVEYFYFQTTLNTLKWNLNLVPNSPLDSCLSISLLPSVYQLFTKMPNPEYLFKGLYVFIFSFTPLIIYKISKKYVNSNYAFLASFFFMSQYFFMKTAASARTNLAVFFVALLVMVIFDDKLSDVQKKILALIFLIAVIISHYSTAYILLIIIGISWILTQIVAKKFQFKRNISILFLLLFASLIFLWYGQITEGAFTKGVYFMGKTFLGINNFFLNEMREDSLNKLVGVGLTSPILSYINLILTWTIFAFVGMGIINTFWKYKENLKISTFNIKCDLINKKIEIEFALMALIACFLLAITILLPFISKGYDLQRVYLIATVFLSIFFILGGLKISQFLKIKNKQYIILLLILIPYSLFSTGAVYEIAGFQSDATLSSNKTVVNQLYISDGECTSAIWISNNYINKTIYTPDSYSRNILISQGLIPLQLTDQYSIPRGNAKLKGYVYFSNFAITEGIKVNNSSLQIKDYNPLTYRNKIYDSGSSIFYN